MGTALAYTGNRFVHHTLFIFREDGWDAGGRWRGLAMAVDDGRRTSHQRLTQ